MTVNNTLGASVELLIDALRKHAATMTRDADPTVVMPVINEVRSAALAYVNEVFEQTGWGNVFADLHDDEDDEDWDDEDDAYEVEEGLERLSLTGRWDFLVKDAVALQSLAAERLRANHPEADPDDIAEHSDTPGAALEALVAMDVGNYAGLEGAGGGWKIEPISKTLFEMSDDEREESGY